MTNKLRLLLVVMIAATGILIAARAHRIAFANATLQIVRGSGEFQSFETAITVDKPEAITLQWTTDQSGATGGTWTVRNVSAGNTVVASGESGAAPAAGHFARFTIAANAFLAVSPPATPVKFSITIVPHNAAKQPLGAVSPAVTVTQVVAEPQKPIDFGPGAVFPDVELVSYREKIGVVPNTQLHFAGADVTLHVSYKGKGASDPIWINVKDENVLMRSANPVSVPSLKSGVSQNVKVHLNAVLPPPTSQLPEEKQYSQWNQQYRDRCGIDLRVVLDWRGPQAQAPVNDHREDYLYQGFGDSNPWQENLPLGDKVICDDKNCVSITQVSRNIYKQIGCKVVGYASFVGERVTGVRGKFQTFGKSRTSLDPPETNFAPTTKMQIASTSKVLTALAGMRVFGNKLNNLAFNNFPSNWTLPQSTIVKNITFREFLSQTSGVQQYYASSNGQDFASMQTFFTQKITNPNAARTCPGSCTPAPPGSPPGSCGSPIIMNPIVSDKTPCYSNTNFGIMRLLMPRFAGAATNDPAQLAQQYVKQVQDNVFTPVGVQNVACKPPASPSAYALLYKYPGNQFSADWKDLTLVCGDWGWYVSVEDYAKVLVSLNSADHKLLSDCQYNDMEINPATHPVGWDINSDGAGHRWLEKNGADGSGNGALQTTSVGIYGGRSGCGGTSPIPGVAGVLFINSDILNQKSGGAWSVLLKAFQDATKPKP